MMCLMTPASLIAFDPVGLIGPRTVVMTSAIFAAVVLYRHHHPKPVSEQLGSGGVLPPPLFATEPNLVRGTIVAYYATVVFIMATFSPERQVSTGCHQKWGPCNVVEPDMLGYPRTKYNCYQQFPKWYWTVDCPAADADANGRWARITPTEAMTSPDHGLQGSYCTTPLCVQVGSVNLATWYTICGTPHTNWPLWQFAVTALSVMGSCMYLYALSAKDPSARKHAHVPTRRLGPFTVDTMRWRDSLPGLDAAIPDRGQRRPASLRPAGRFA